MSAISIQLASTRHFSVRVDRGGIEVIDALAADWRRLCDTTPKLEPFYRPEWVSASIRAFFPDAELLVLTAWTGRRLRGILPLMIQRGIAGRLSVRNLRFPGNIHVARVGLAHCAGEEGAEAVRALWDALKSIRGWQMIDLSFVVEGNGFDELAACAEADGFRTARTHLWQSLHLPLRPSEDGHPSWMASTRPKFRSNLRRAHRQLAEQGVLTLRHVATADPESLEAFFAIESSGWKGTEGTAIACDPSTRQFYQEIAEEAARSGYLSLDFLQLNGVTIAAHFGLNLNGRYQIVKAGYDERYHRWSPGQVLVHEVLKALGGVRELDFVGPATWDESRWAQARRNHYHISVFRKSLYGELSYAARFGLRSKLKSLLRRAPASESDAESPTPRLHDEDG